MQQKKIYILEAADQLFDPVWDELTGYAEVTAVRDGETAYHLLREKKFDLVLVNLMLHGLDGLELMRRIKRERLCQFVILTSEFPDFQYAQQGILYGAFDYLLRPLTKEVLMDLIFRVKKRMQHIDYMHEQESRALAKQIGQPHIEIYFDKMIQRMDQQYEDDIELDITIRQVYHDVIEQVFCEKPWLYRFEQIESYEAIDWLRGSEHHTVRNFCRRKLTELSETIAALYPPTQDKKLTAILQHLLEHIDDNCLQKDIAAAHYISSTALSDLFRSQLHTSYHNYITDMKMLRAKYLLQHSDKKIYEISALLGYKDVNYFSKIFRQRYGIPLSQFRHSKPLDYQI